MSQGLKSDDGKYVAVRDSGETLDRVTSAPNAGRVTFYREQAAIWQTAENMRKSAEVAADLLVRMAVEKSRARLLLEMNMRLWSCRDEKTTFSTLSSLFVPMLADGICIFTWRKNELQRRTFAHADCHKENLVSSFAEKLESLAAQHVDWWDEVLISGRRVNLSGPTLNAAFGNHFSGTESDHAYAALDIRWLDIWPLISAHRVLGAIVLFGTASRNEFDVGGGDMVESLVDCASAAVVNAEAHDYARQSILARDRLMAVAAHDLRNSLSLAVMSLSVCETLGEVPSGSPLSPRIAVVRKGVGRMQRLIDDLLDFSSLETGHLSLVFSSQSVAALVEDIVETFRPAAAEKGIRLVSLPLVDGCHIECDGFRLSQVFSNLVGNALKFTPRGGEIIVSATDCGSEVEFKVSDTGSGISATELPHVFEAYRQAHEGRSVGLGLGLSIASGIVGAHGGRIWGESRPGEGTTFFFRIPKRAATSASRSRESVAP